jgi:peptidoglycan biosynthesis protein MviN/MurJ (putative lipid II flippase)
MRGFEIKLVANLVPYFHKVQAYKTNARNDHYYTTTTTTTILLKIHICALIKINSSVVIISVL